MTGTVNSLDPEEVRAAVSPDDCRQQVQLVETAALCQTLVAKGKGATAQSLWVNGQSNAADA